MIMNFEKLKELVKSGEIIQSHSAYKRGYLPVGRDQEVVEYSGKFGKGYILKTANLRTCRASTRYFYITYYVFSK